MPIFRQNSACARFYRSCPRLVRLARWVDGTEWIGSPRQTTARSPSSWWAILPACLPFTTLTAR